MWTNELLKNNAKACLKNYYWYAVLYCFLTYLVTSSISGVVMSVLSGITSVIGTIFSAVFGISSTALGAAGEEAGSDAMMVGAGIGMVLGMIVLYAIIYILTLAVSLLANTFVTMPFNMVGLNRYFMVSRTRKGEINDILFPIKSKQYKNIAKVSFFYNLYIILWTLLFVIPGIIKTYEYFLVPYILAENPSISKERAFEISKKTMEGEKMNTFILQLSFIGWSLLLCLATIMTFGLGALGAYCLVPYMNATFVELYTCLREKALTNGYATPEELIGY
ncbi:MAG: DUF975 family protein [Oscillospiraceae bacterium]|nr:DUF975 family protein [Oscillospiraceae bacterium]